MTIHRRTVGRLSPVLVTLTIAATVAACSSSKPTSTGASATSSATPQAASQISLLETGDSIVAGPLQQLSSSGLFQQAGVKINLINPGGSDQQVDQRLQADKVAGNLPDLAVVSSASVRTYVDAGLAQPLDQFISSDSSYPASDVNAGLLASGKDKGKQYAMPFLAGFLVLYYNPKEFQQAGLNPNSPPTTLSQFAADANTIVKAKAAKYGGAFAYDSDDAWPLQNFVASAGASWTDSTESKVTFQTPQLESILTTFSGMAKKGDTTAMARDTAREAFYRGDLAMLIDSSGTYATAQKNANFGPKYTSFPVPEGSTRKMVLSSETLMMFTKDPAKQAAAWKVIKQIIGHTGSTDIINAGGGGLLAMSNSANAAGSSTYPILKTGLDDSTAGAAPWYQFPGTHGTEIWTGLANHVVAILQGKQEPAAALGQAQSDAQSLLP